LAKTSQVVTTWTDFAWIGLHQANWPESDVWTWTDGTPYDYKAWSPGEPNDYEQDQHCVQLYNAPAPSSWDLVPGKWDDYQCNSTMKSLLCKRSTLTAPTVKC
ncbi:lectin C-type domain protein, partial [Teladorsagia circumcincta]